MESIILRFPGAIISSLVIALLIMLIPLPADLENWRPEWGVLVVIHWAILLPRQISYWAVWLFGLILDVAYSTFLGQHALSMIVVLFITLRLSARISPRDLIQQLSVLFITIGVYLLLNLWMLGVSGTKPDLSYWYSLPSSLFVWPILLYVMRLFYKKKKEF